MEPGDGIRKTKEGLPPCRAKHRRDKDGAPNVNLRLGQAKLSLGKWRNL